MLDDLALVIDTNSPKIKKYLINYQISKDIFKLYSYYWKDRIICNNLIKKNIDDNSCLLIGQVDKDLSIIYNRKMLSFLDYQKEINIFKKQYNTIYLKPHPMLSVEKYPAMQQFIKNNPDIKIFDDNDNIYCLLSSDKIKHVVAISSSVLFEAQCFGKKTTYLYQSFFNFNEKQLTSCVDILFYKTLNPKFWANILQDEMLLPNDIPDLKFQDNTNKIRDIHGYWGMYDLLPYTKLEKKINARIDFNNISGKECIYILIKKILARMKRILANLKFL